MRAENTMNFFKSFGMQVCLGRKWGTGKEFFHPGFAWAITRKAYEQIGGLFELGVLGAGDNLMAHSFICNAELAINQNAHPGYIASLLEFEEKSSRLRVGYVPGVIKHHFHGSKKNRKYIERWKILIKYAFDPQTQLAWDCRINATQ